MASICVYCGSSPGSDPAFLQSAREVGALLAKRGHTLVYGGGNVGLMGAVADAVMAAGGHVVGVIPDHLASKELAHNGLTKLHVVASMHERKHLMASLADGFLALPGGDRDAGGNHRSLRLDATGVARQTVRAPQCEWLLRSAGFLSHAHDRVAVSAGGTVVAIDCGAGTRGSPGSTVVVHADGG